MADNTNTLPEMPTNLSADDESRWYILRERFNRMDADIRGQEALGGNPPPWLNRRRAERGALVWAMQLVAKHHDCAGKETFRMPDDIDKRVG